MPAGYADVIGLILGPAGALALAVLIIASLVQVIRVLWRTHLKADLDDREQRDRAITLAESLVASNKAMAAAWDARNRADAARRRREDAR